MDESVTVARELGPAMERRAQYAGRERRRDGAWPPFLVGQADKPTRVMLVDDDAHMRRVIANELLADSRIDLVAQGASVRDGKRLLLATQHEFDVLLVDLHLGDGTGFELIELARLRHPLCETVMLSSMEDEGHALRAFELGATGFLVKNSWFGGFSQAVLQVVNGGSAITPSLMRRLIKQLGRNGQDPHRSSGPNGSPQTAGVGERLSERERVILRQVAQGHTSDQIGRHLEISGQTVNTHLKNIYRKMQVHNRAQAVTLASRCGLLY